jgi:hypothetical protein
VYFEPAFPLLHETLLRLSGLGHVEIFMAYKKRRKVFLCQNTSDVQADRRFFQGIKKDFEIIEVFPFFLPPNDIG